MKVEIREVWSVEQSPFNDPEILVNCTVYVSENFKKLARLAKVDSETLKNYLEIDDLLGRHFTVTVDTTNYQEKIHELRREVKEYIQELRREVEEFEQELKNICNELIEIIEAREELIKDIKDSLPENKTYTIHLGGGKNDE